MKTNDQLIKTISESQMFKDYQRAFSAATGLPLAIRSEQDWAPAFRGVPKENAFCRMIAVKGRACSGCHNLEEKICHSAVESGKTAQCPYGMMEIAVPVRLGPKTIGYLRTGQVFDHEVNEQDFERIFGLFESAGVKIDAARVRCLLPQSRVLPKAQLDSMRQLLSIFAEHLAIKSNVLAIRSRNSEPVAVTRAKEFVEANYVNDISLGDAAKAAHTSTFYLCKLLKKSVGVSFTELLCRRRLEGAKQLLANPNLRISEIAYEVGFQSLTHFNRIFKKLVGESPTQYREAVPMGKAA